MESETEGRFGTPTLLLTDIEGSTRLLERAPTAYREALDLHHSILRRLTAHNGGRELQDGGDGFFLAFDDPSSAVGAAISMQQEFAVANWPREVGVPKVRMAVHWGEAEFREGQYRGAAVHLAARLLAAAHGGQILCSSELVAVLDSRHKVRRLGTFRLRGFQAAREIYQLEEGGHFPPLRAEHARQHNLPAEQGEFVGRSVELRDLGERLAPNRPGARLVLLTGVGGIGKTRLALAAAYQLLEQYGNGVLFVPLAERYEAVEVPYAILTAFGVEVTNVQDPVAQVKETLAGGPTLVILDNFENMATEGQAVLTRLLRDLPGLRLLVTSRVRLGLHGEEEIALGPLPVPVEGEEASLEQNDGARLFLKRAASSRPGFSVEAADLGDVGEICRLLGGLPLAIELAAARLQVLTTQELKEALRENFSIVGEQGSLTAVFEWSRRLLPPPIAEFLGVLSVFRGGWTATSAQEVGVLENRSLVLAYLHYLLTCSLIRVAEVGTTLRFTMLEPIRQLAESGLGEGRAGVVSRHGRYFRDLARKVNADCETAREEVLAQEIEPEIANVLAALEREPENQTRVFSAVDFHSFALRRGCNKAVRALLTELRPGQGPVKPETLARAWHASGALSRTAGERELAKIAFQKAARIFEETGEKDGAISAYFNLSSILSEEGEKEEAYRTSLRTLEYFRERDNPVACTTILAHLARESRKLGWLEIASRHAEECLGLCEQFGLDGSRSQILSTYARIRLMEGSPEAAKAYLVESLRLQRKLGWQTSVADTLAELAIMSCHSGEWRRCSFFSGAALASARKWKSGFDEETTLDLRSSERACLERLGEEEFHREVNRGAEAEPDEWLAETKISPENQNSLQSLRLSA